MYFTIRKQFSVDFIRSDIRRFSFSVCYALFMRFKRDLIRMLMFITCVNMSTTNSNFEDDRPHGLVIIVRL